MAHRQKPNVLDPIYAAKTRIRVCKEWGMHPDPDDERLVATFATKEDLYKARKEGTTDL